MRTEDLIKKGVKNSEDLTLKDCGQIDAEVVGAPAGELAAALDGFFVGYGAHEVEGEVSHDGHVFGGAAFAQPALVVLEDDVHDPVQAVFDGQWLRTACWARAAVRSAEETS